MQDQEPKTLGTAELKAPEPSLKEEPFIIDRLKDVDPQSDLILPTGEISKLTSNKVSPDRNQDLLNSKDELVREGRRRV